MVAQNTNFNFRYNFLVHATMNAHGLPAKQKFYTLGRYSQFLLRWNIVSTISVIVARTSCGWSFAGATQPGIRCNPEAMREPHARRTLFL